MQKSTYTSSRRKFIQNSALATASIPFLIQSPNAMAQMIGEQKSKSGPLQILILGGTSFLGPHQIAYALERGHKVTTFTRGKTKPTVHTELFDQVEQLIGDREDNLEALKGRSWDAVIDNSGRRVHWTKATSELLKDNVGIYAYTSTVSVFYPYYKSGATEAKDVVRSMPDQIEDESERRNYEYGIMKANSESEAIKSFGAERTIVVRPTFMTGPADRTDRFVYWSTQLSKGGDIVIPGREMDPVQFIDVRDIAEFMVRLIEEKTSGIFNGVGPASPMTIRAFVHGAHAAFNSPVNYIYMDDYDFLDKNEFSFQAPWVMDRPKYHGISRVDNSKAIEAGLTFRPLAQTINDTHEWWYSDAVSNERRQAYIENAQALHNRQERLINAWRKK